MITMFGASRVSLETLREQVTRRTAPARILPPLPVPEPQPERPGLQPEHREEGARALRRLTDDLFAVAGLLDRRPALRGALADGGTPEDDRAAIVDQLLSGRIGNESLEVVKEAVRLRWSSSLDLVDALEVVGAQAAFTASEAAGTLDRVEDELFRFGRILAAQPQLQTVLDDPVCPPTASSPCSTACLRIASTRRRCCCSSTSCGLRASGHSKMRSPTWSSSPLSGAVGFLPR